MVFHQMAVEWQLKRMRHKVKKAVFQWQLSYVTHSGEGEGLLFFGNVILPFVDHFPKDLELYRILTTRLSEVAEAQKHE